MDAMQCARDRILTPSGLDERRIEQALGSLLGASVDAGDLYFQLEMTGPGSLAVGAAAGASYLNGSAYLNDLPAADGQLAFKLAIAPIP
jgi:hypothetical protein